MSPEEEIRFWAQIVGDSHRTVLCPPGRVAELEAAVKARGLDRTLTVRANRICPDASIIVLTDVELVRMQRRWPQRPDRRAVLSRLPAA